MQNNDSNSNLDLPTTDPHAAHKHVTFTEDNVVVIDDVTSPDVEGDDTSSEDDVSDAQGDGEDDGDVTRRRKTQLIHVERERPTSAFDFHPLRNQKLKLNNNSLTKTPALTTAATPDAPAADASTDVIDATTAVPMTSADTSDVSKDSAHDRLMRKQDGGRGDSTCKKRRDDVSVRSNALCLGVASVLIFIAFCGLVVLVILYVTRQQPYTDNFRALRTDCF